MAKRKLKIHIFDLVAAMVFLGKKVTPEDIANHLHSTCWGDVDKYDILPVVVEALKTELDKRPEDHYGLRKSETCHLYWLSYSINRDF